MTSSAGGDAPRARIMAHMNASHQRELSHYLRHYLGLSPRTAADPEMTSVSLEGMVISAKGKEYSIPFDPPLASWAEARPRVIEMDAVARKHLGLSGIYITSYAPPRGFDIVVGSSVAFYFFCYLTLPFVKPGTLIWRFLETVFPGGGDGYVWIVRTIFLLVFGIHISEVYWFHRSRLLPQGVQAGSSLWWKWIISTFFEGVCTFLRIDGIIEAKRKEKETKSH
jgi:hypothetical protein